MTSENEEILETMRGGNEGLLFRLVESKGPGLEGQELQTQIAVEIAKMAVLLLDLSALKELNIGLEMYIANEEEKK